MISDGKIAPVVLRCPEWAALELVSFRQVPAKCHCEWTVTVTTPGAKWRITRRDQSCPVHGDEVSDHG